MSVQSRASEWMGVCDQYRASLEQRVKQGDAVLVCHDRPLCDRAQNLLREGDLRLLFSPLGLDPLPYMTSVSCGPGLDGLSKAFEVLELAALNLYLCPWRKEYRIIKMFSGTFTHLVRSVLSEEQTNVLFGLLGYHKADGRGRGEELELKDPPPPADNLRRLACAFFLARCECHLQLSASRLPGLRVGWEKALVQERQKGHGMEAALDNLWRYTEKEKEQQPALDMELDLYTAGTTNSESSSVSTGEEPDTVQAKSSYLYLSGNSLPAGGRTSHTQDGMRFASTLTKQISSKGLLGPTWTLFPNDPTVGERSLQTEVSRGGGDEKTWNVCATCRCTEMSLTTYQCTTCQVVHILHCEQLETCERQGHYTQPTSLEKTHWAGEPKAPGDAHLKDWFTYSAKGDRSCLTSLSYSGSMTAYENKASGRDHQTTRIQGSPAIRGYPVRQPIEAHFCVHPFPGPWLVCFTCGILHNVACSTGVGCKEKHKAEVLKSCTREDCKGTADVLCKYCCTMYCRTCWLRESATCQCGHSIDTSTPV